MPKTKAGLRTRTVSSFARPRRASAMFGLLLALVVAPVALVVAPADPVIAASVGSVPAEVRAFVADGLLQQLDDYFGPGANGEGVTFDETTTFGEIHRVFEWTDGFRGGDGVEAPVRRLNEWITIVSIDDSPIGVATVTIEPNSVLPELGDFRRSSVLASALAPSLAEFDGETILVRESAVAAWFALEGEDLRPLVSGSSGIAAPTVLSDYQRLLLRRDAPPAAAEPTFGAGFVLPAIVVVATIILLVVFLLSPAGRRRPEEEEAEGESDEVSEGEPDEGMDKGSTEEPTEESDEDSDDKPGEEPGEEPDEPTDEVPDGDESPGEFAREAEGA